MSRRARTLLVVWVAVGVALLSILALPVPYVVLTATVPVNTLGQDPNTKNTPVLKINDAKLAQPTTGALLLTTVGVRSGHVTMGEALRHWFSGADAVVPRSVEYPSTQSTKETNEQNVKAMADSRQSAVVAALNELKFPETIIGEISAGSRAVGLLQAGDQITDIDDAPTATFAAISTAISKHRPGDVVSIRVLRAGAAKSVSVPLIENPDKAGTPLLGVSRVNVTISLADVSGPSAGLMFSLGTIDKLTPGSLTGGKIIAGTGTIDSDGTVGTIGGIQQKLHGARNAGATFFLVPDGNCDEARNAHVKGLTLVKVPEKGGLHSAYLALQQIEQGGTSYARC